MRPSIHSIAKNAVSCSRPTSWMVRMFGVQRGCRARFLLTRIDPSRAMAAVIASVMPSAKNSCESSPERFSKGRTTMVRRPSSAQVRRALVPRRRVPPGRRPQSGSARRGPSTAPS